MREAIDEVIALRAYDPAGLSRALTWSYALHAVLIVAFIVFPRQWLTRTKPPEKVMTAIEDSDVLEASTPELTDVVRLEDRYGRAGGA